ncbi:MAG: hypothetical protein M1836_007220 [Candelina mexicana]|nr:MAG: hypothetical protein M1836_007220 [Candelina mexicana]
MYRQPTPNNPDPMGFRGVPTTDTAPEHEKRSFLHPFGKTESPEVGIAPTRDESLGRRTRNITGGSTSSGDSPTESHALAAADHGVKGAAQQDHGAAEVKDLGWQEHVSKVPTPLVGGLPNEELWVLVRRFNKQMYHVKATTDYLPGGLDLNIADEEEFSPDKLRANIERLYMTVIIGLIGFGKHIARLRSWREPRRTAIFCTTYFTAWFFNLTIPLYIVTTIILIAYPPARAILFPPAPLALVDSNTGGVKTPSAGMLGSHDSATGAAEKHKGEAVEQEAHNFVSSFGAIALSSAAGKNPHTEAEEDESVDKSVPDPTNVALHASNARVSTKGGSSTTKHDKTKQPMEATMWIKARPVMHVIADIADGWERFANALSPTKPFPQDEPRLKLAAILVPGVAVSLLTSPAAFVKMSHFFVGFGFFADPVIWRAAHWLNQEFPNWQKLLEIRNTLLKGVPTNAQLTITLLRIGEANKAPLPPPPQSSEPPPTHPPALSAEDVGPLDASHEEVQDAIHKDPAQAREEHLQEQEQAKKPKHGSKIIGFFKGTTKTGVETKLGVDHVRAKIGSEHAKNRLGVLPDPKEQVLNGPVEFKGRYKGKKGDIFISTASAIPYVAFTRDTSSDKDDADEAFHIPIADITELVKKGGLGWKAKIVVGWATNRNINDALEIVDKSGNTTRLTAIPLREELFNRLVAMGPQKWEAW